MHCEAWRGALSAELDGELDGAERVDLLRHLDECPSCAAWLEESRRIGRRLGLRAVEPAPDLHSLLLPLVDLRTICGCGETCRCAPECTCGDLCACRATH